MEVSGVFISWDTFVISSVFMRSLFRRCSTACDIPAFNRFFHAMLERGVFLAPSAYEAGFISSAHDEAVINATIEAAREAFRAVAS